ncbi:MAG: FAD-dependent oxidoreductase, partial [Pararhodobacter sp.]|nr:FAD-dependent oxidoreductase [Pararhodobacter sp.]
MAEITVIGAGVAGLWAARALSCAGFTPRLFDRHGAPGAHGCSWWAGGMLAPFCEGATAEPQIVAHGQRAAGDWAQVTKVVQRGSLVVALARDRGELARFARRTSGHQPAGDTLHMLEPDLPGIDQALHFPDEAHLDPRRALTDLTADLAARGVPIRRETVTPDAFAGPVIDARGLAAALPGLRGGRGEMVVLHAPDIRLTRPVRLLHPRHPLYIVPRGGGLYMLGATQIESADRRPGTAPPLREKKRPPKCHATPHSDEPVNHTSPPHSP